MEITNADVATTLIFDDVDATTAERPSYSTIQRKVSQESIFEDSLHKAILKQQSLSKIEALILHNPLLLSARDKEGRLPLHIAAIQCRDKPETHITKWGKHANNVTEDLNDIIPDHELDDQSDDVDEHLNENNMVNGKPSNSLHNKLKYPYTEPVAINREGCPPQISSLSRQDFIKPDSSQVNPQQ
jgi:hypothetical protein